MRARDLMSTNFVTVEGTATIEEAVALMKEHHVQCLIVSPRDEYDVTGIITERDIVYKVVATGANPKVALVHQIMTQPLVVIDPSLGVKFVARLFAENRITRAPVMDKNSLLGIISLTDIIERGM